MREGGPAADPHAAARRVARMGLAMAEGVGKIASERGLAVTARIGIHTGMVIGGIIGNAPDEAYKNHATGTLLLNQLMVCLVYGTLCAVASLSVFSADRFMFWRESSEDASTSAFFFARTSIDSFFVVLRTFVFVRVALPPTQFSKLSGRFGSNF